MTNPAERLAEAISAAERERFALNHYQTWIHRHTQELLKEWLIEDQKAAETFAEKAAYLNTHLTWYHSYLDRVVNTMKKWQLTSQNTTTTATNIWA